MCDPAQYPERTGEALGWDYPGLESTREKVRLYDWGFSTAVRQVRMSLCELETDAGGTLLKRYPTTTAIQSYATRGGTFYQPYI